MGKAAVEVSFVSFLSSRPFTDLHYYKCSVQSAAAA
jgi:hypothetical protein